jgi:hypothetical protein
MLEKILKKIFAPRAHFVFGEGGVLLQSATFEGKHVIVLSPATKAGIVGLDARPYERSAENADVLSKSVILSFQSEEHRDAVESALLGRFK